MLITALDPERRCINGAVIPKDTDVDGAAYLPTYISEQL
jgi:hypothetical protein